MNNTSEKSGESSRDLQLAFDVGHSSIGWAVLKGLPHQSPALLGCGSVIFPADDCLASTRRAFRRQRRHIRSTRQRIARMACLLEHLLADTDPMLVASLAIYRDLKRHHELTGTGHAAPWLLAARVLRSGPLLTWPELWDVLRWYAHNRGYDGNKAWSRHEVDAAAEQDDTEKVEKAKGLLADFAKKHGRPGSMAEVWCDLSGLDPLGTKISCHLPGDKRPKAQNAAFPREDVENEVGRILHAHFDHLPHVDEKLLAALMTEWRTLPAPTLRLPLRFSGGLLFGQLVPRFENRIIARCPITYEHIYQRVLTETGDLREAKETADKLSKVPSADCVEFFRYRWAMQLANIQIATADQKHPRRLSAAERQTLDAQMRDRGAFTKGDFKKTVRALTGGAPDNLDQMLVHPDAEKALVVDPAQRLIASDDLAPWFATLPERLQKRLRGQLRQGKRLNLGGIRAWLENTEALAAFDAELDRRLDSSNTKRGKTTAAPTREKLLATTFQIPPVSGRAPHSREIMRAVVDFVLTTGRHPAGGTEGAPDNGPLYRSDAIRRAQLQRAIDEQTNNHLVRHRLRLLDRLHLDILQEYAGDNKDRIDKITIEVNRDLKELSGMTRKEQEMDMGRRLYNFKSVTDKLEKELAGKNIPITPGLIRKARIAEDLGWTCPYTGLPYDIYDLIHRRVDKDHIIPRSERPSDSLDSLVITFSEINRMKGKRTAVQFVTDCQSLAVEDRPQLSIKPLTTFLKDVEALENFKGHDDDKRRKKNRKRLLLLKDYVEKEFVPGDLTQTSQLVRLGAQALERAYLGSARDARAVFGDSPKTSSPTAQPQISQSDASLNLKQVSGGSPETARESRALPVITSLPGSVTGSVRKSWHLLPLLKAANLQVMDPATGEVRTKTEIRDITHLHHALDACTLAFASHFLPRDGGIWELLLKRNLTAPEQETLLNVRHGLFQRQTDGRVSLLDLPEIYKAQIRQHLAECRVVQHVPADMSGLLCDETVYRVFDPLDPHPSARQLAKWFDRKEIAIPAPDADTALITCRKRRGGAGPESGKLLHETKTWRWVWQLAAKSALLGLEPKEEATAKLKPLKAVKILGDNFGLAILDKATDPAERIVLLRHHKVWNQIAELRQQNSGKWPRILRIGVLVQVPNKTGRSNYRGVWMIRGVTLDQRAGYLVDMSSPDRIKYRISGQHGCFKNISLVTLLRDGLQIVNASLTGVKALPSGASA